MNRSTRPPYRAAQQSVAVVAAVTPRGVLRAVDAMSWTDRPGRLIDSIVYYLGYLSLVTEQVEWTGYIYRLPPRGSAPCTT